MQEVVQISAQSIVQEAVQIQEGGSGVSKPGTSSSIGPTQTHVGPKKIQNNEFKNDNDNEFKNDDDNEFKNGDDNEFNNDEDSESKNDDDNEFKNDDDSEFKSDDDSEVKNDDDSEFTNDDDSESKNDVDSESKNNDNSGSKNYDDNEFKNKNDDDNKFKNDDMSYSDATSKNARVAKFCMMRKMQIAASAQMSVASTATFFLTSRVARDVTISRNSSSSWGGGYLSFLISTQVTCQHSPTTIN